MIVEFNKFFYDGGGGILETKLGVVGHGGVYGGFTCNLALTRLCNCFTNIP